jgi:transposase
MYRKRAVEYMEEGHTEKETSEVFKVGTTSLKRWKNEITNKRMSGSKYTTAKRKARKLPEKEVREYIKAHPDELIREQARHFMCSESGMSKALQRYKITKKKDPIV